MCHSFRWKELYTVTLDFIVTCNNQFRAASIPSPSKYQDLITKLIGRLVQVHQHAYQQKPDADTPDFGKKAQESKQATVLADKIVFMLGMDLSDTVTSATDLTRSYSSIRRVSTSCV